MRLHGAIIVGRESVDALRWAPLRTAHRGHRYPWHVLKSTQLLSEFVERFKPAKFAGQKSSIVYHLIADETDLECWFDANTPMLSLFAGGVS